MNAKKPIGNWIELILILSQHTHFFNGQRRVSLSTRISEWRRFNEEKKCCVDITSRSTIFFSFFTHSFLWDASRVSINKMSFLFQILISTSVQLHFCVFSTSVQYLAWNKFLLRFEFRKITYFYNLKIQTRTAGRNGSKCIQWNWNRVEGINCLAFFHKILYCIDCWPNQSRFQIKLSQNISKSNCVWISIRLWSIRLWRRSNVVFQSIFLFSPFNSPWIPVNQFTIIRKMIILFIRFEYPVANIFIPNGIKRDYKWFVAVGRMECLAKAHFNIPTEYLLW